MNKRFRITQSTDFARVRRLGKSYAHPLIVLVAIPNQIEKTRVGVVAGKKIGGAVIRNRAKRQIRAAAQGLLPGLAPGWDLIFIARQLITTARFTEIEQAMQSLTRRAGIAKIDRNDGAPASRIPE